jgi:hypothetical protein
MERVSIAKIMNVLFQKVMIRKLAVTTDFEETYLRSPITIWEEFLYGITIVGWGRRFRKESGL